MTRLDFVGREDHAPYGILAGAQICWLKGKARFQNCGGWERDFAIPHYP